MGRIVYFSNLILCCVFVSIVSVTPRHVGNHRSSAHGDISKSGQPGEYLWYNVALKQAENKVAKSHVERSQEEQMEGKATEDTDSSGDENDSSSASATKDEMKLSRSDKRNEQLHQNEENSAEGMDSFVSGVESPDMSGSGSYASSYMVDVEDTSNEENTPSESDAEVHPDENETSGNDTPEGSDSADSNDSNEEGAQSESATIQVEKEPRLKEHVSSGGSSLKEDSESKSESKAVERQVSDFSHSEEAWKEHRRSKIYKRKDLDGSKDDREYDKLFKDIENDADLDPDKDGDDADFDADFNEDEADLLTPQKDKDEPAKSKSVINRHNGKEEILSTTENDDTKDLSDAFDTEDSQKRFNERSRSAKTKEILSKLDSDIFNWDEEQATKQEDAAPKPQYHQRYHKHLRHLQRHSQNQEALEASPSRALSHHADKGIFNGSVSKVTLQEEEKKHRKHHHGYQRHHHHHHGRLGNYTHKEVNNTFNADQLEDHPVTGESSAQYDTTQIQSNTAYNVNGVYYPAMPAAPGNPYQPSAYQYFERPSASFEYYSVEIADSVGAVCLDGSAPGYYLRKGYGRGEKRWIIYLQGGAWCDSKESCLKRSQMHLGSSLFFEPNLKPGGILSNNSNENPDFYDWNVAYLPYCDGSSFSGNRSDPVDVDGTLLYFRGFRILNSTIAELLSRRDLSNANQVIFSGTSAGGLAVMLHADFVHSMLPKRVYFRALADSGFFLDTASRKSKGKHKFRKEMQNVFKLHDCTDGVPQECVEEMPGKDLWKCIFPQHFLRFVDSKMYIVNPLYDSWQLGSIWGISCAFNPYTCTTKDVKMIKKFRSATLKALQPVLESKPNIGLFADSCIDHGQVIFSAQWNTLKVKESSIASSFADWFKKSSQSKYVIDVDEYPANPTCVVKNYDKRSEILTEGF